MSTKKKIVLTVLLGLLILLSGYASFWFITNLFYGYINFLAYLHSFSYVIVGFASLIFSIIFLIKIWKTELIKTCKKIEYSKEEYEKEKQEKQKIKDQKRKDELLKELSKYE